jgi:hypothetical protein
MHGRVDVRKGRVMEDIKRLAAELKIIALPKTEVLEKSDAAEALGLRLSIAD